VFVFSQKQPEYTELEQYDSEEDSSSISPRSSSSGFHGVIPSSEKVFYTPTKDSSHPTQPVVPTVGSTLATPTTPTEKVAAMRFSSSSIFPLIELQVAPEDEDDNGNENKNK
jgi:hypothetical protein